ncbi:MAG: hypothetical protein KIT57_17060 [Blastocatellales bacterium]|nr:hypothetical protein [Blastocatellales bacterium]
MRNLEPIAKAIVEKSRQYLSGAQGADFDNCHKLFALAHGIQMGSEQRRNLAIGAKQFYRLNDVEYTKLLIELRKYPFKSPISSTPAPVIDKIEHNRPNATTTAPKAVIRDSKGWLFDAKPPASPQSTASAFADWVFHWSKGRYLPQFAKSVESHTRNNRLELGVMAHRQIEDFFSLTWTQKKFPESKASDWEMVFADSQGYRGKKFLASRLKVNGQPLTCVPDAVLWHTFKNVVLIIERKTTAQSWKFIPKDGWPNIQAQLWCYSWIDEWATATDVILVGQFWSRRSNGLILGREHPCWRRGSKNFHRQCLEWFERYGGQFIDS